MTSKTTRIRKQFSSTMREDLYSKLQEYSERTDIPMSKLFDRAIEEYLNREKDM